MDPNDLADAGKAWLDQVEAHIEGMDPGPDKTVARAMAKAMHSAAYGLKQFAVSRGIVQPFSGGDPDKP